MIKMIKEKGFTLIELLAVITIIGILALIAVPVISNIVDNTSNKIFHYNEKLIITAAESYYKMYSNKLPNYISNNKVVTLTTLIEEGLIKKINNPNDNTECNGYVVVSKTSEEVYDYTSYLKCGSDFVTNGYSDYPIISLIGPSSITINQGDLYIDEGAVAIDEKDGDLTSNLVITNNVSNMNTGNYTVTYKATDTNGNITQITRTVTVNAVTTTDYLVSKGVNKPRLITGMTPIKWDSGAWVATTESDTTWYNYSGGYFQWANARTADGSMWVWIPRYAYQLSSNYHTSSIGNTYVKFLKNTSNVASDNSIVYEVPTYNGSNQTNYIVHPAFTFGTTELTGIWVAKFEASVSDVNDLCYTSASDTNCNKTTLIPKMAPNAKSWRYIDIGNMFTVTRNMETNSAYGWGTSGTGIDTHLMKNVEWGAAVYLSQSTAARWYEGEIWINPANDFTTGCAGSSSSSAATTGCLNTYDTTNGKNASTSQSGMGPYGIFDMNGGAAEYTAAYVDNGNGTTYGSSIVNAASKYKDIYTIKDSDSGSNNYANTLTKKGDAIYETSATYTGTTIWSDAIDMPSLTNLFFVRGGKYSDGSVAGAYNFKGNTGLGNDYIGFRPVLLVDSSL